MALEYPFISKRLSHDSISTIYNNLLFCPPNYEEQLEYYKGGIQSFKSIGYIHPNLQKRNKYVLEYGSSYLKEPTQLQLFPHENDEEISNEEIERKRKVREELNSRIREANRKKNDEKKQAKKKDLEIFEGALKEIKTLEEDDEELGDILLEFDFVSIEDLERAIKKLKVDLGLISKEELAKERFKYINVPDSELNVKQLRQKRFQIMHKKNAEKKALKKKLRKEQKRQMDLLKKDNPDKYLKHLYEIRQVF